MLIRGFSWSAIWGFPWVFTLSFLFSAARFYDWQHREAYLLIREREAKGQVIIDRNLIDPSKVELPSDEELDDTDIII